MSHNDHKVGVTFIWTIKNFCGGFDAHLVSPIFVSSSLNDTEWEISMYPRGYINDDDYISLILTRCGSDDKGIDRIIIDCELSIVDDEDGSLLEWKEVKNHGFVRGHSWTCQKFVLGNELFDLKNREFLRFGTLTVRCRMWRRFDEISQAEFHCSQTKIERTCFVWPIYDFCCLKAHQWKEIFVKKTHSEISILTFRLFLEARKDEVRIEITPAANPIFELSCDISILDCFGKVCKCEYKMFSFKGDPCRISPAVWTFPSFIKKNELVGNKNLYLPMDVLSLRVECFFWTGYTNDKDIQHIPIQNFQVSEKLLSTHKSDKQCMTENVPRVIMFPKQCMTENMPNTLKCDKQTMTETEIIKLQLPTRERESSNEVLDQNSYERFICDMQSMYEEGFLSDFSLRAGNKTFQVHKNILSARSPVFRAMFSTPMKEKEGDGIDVPDMDEYTLQRMLLFVYSNKIGDLEWESVVDLYSAADKYAIEDLKSITCSILKSILTVSNVCEILVHADLHEDQDLKSTAMEFIASHDKETVGTEDWKKFQKERIHLAVEILSILYTKMKK